MTTTSTFSSLGVGSGLNLSSLLDGLRAAEQQRLVPLQNRKAGYNAQLTAYSVLTNSVTDLQSAADKLNDPSLYHSTTVSVSGDAFTATSTGRAVPGRYDVSVSQLAQAQSLVASPVADKTAAIGQGGTISLTVGDNDPVSIEIDSEASSLEDIRDAINNADAGVSASIIDDGSDTPYRLVLSAAESGIDHQITISATDAAGANGTPLADLLNYDSATGAGSLTESVSAQDARLTVNDILVTRDSNTVTDAIQGVTLSLKDVTTEPESVTATRDREAVRGAIEDFVSAFNSYQSTDDRLTRFGGEDAKSGVLLGDGATRSVASRLRDTLYTPVTGGSLSLLSDIGISFDLEGTVGRLKIDDEKLDAALADDPRGVAQLFSGDPAKDADDDGVAGMLSATIGRMTDDKGLLSSASNGIQNSIDDVNDRIADMSDRIDSTIERYRKQFVQLDSLLSSLNATQSYLSTQLSQLNSSSSSS